MHRATPFAVGETYHVYNRGAHKQNIYTSPDDYRRFQLLLHLCNGTGRVDMRALLARYKGLSFADIFERERKESPLVAIYAYCLMPNHFHLVLQEKEPGGITSFLKKVLTGYAMYFNTKYAHSGVLFQGPSKSRHIDSEPYFRYIFSYLHLNPLDLVEPHWKKVGVKDALGVRKFVTTYPYSSFIDYSTNRSEGRLLCVEDAPEFLRSQNDLDDLLHFFTKESPLYVGDNPWG